MEAASLPLRLDERALTFGLKANKQKQFIPRRMHDVFQNHLTNPRSLEGSQMMEVAWLVEVLILLLRYEVLLMRPRYVVYFQK